MSVDPFIQSPTSTQSVNPYSYIMNNPLSGTDPTGYLKECADSYLCVDNSRPSTNSSYGSSKDDVLLGNGESNDKEKGTKQKPVNHKSEVVSTNVGLDQSIWGADALNQAYTDLVWNQPEEQGFFDSLSWSDGVSMVIPGWDVGACLINGCSGSGWAWAAAGIIPIGKAAKAYKMYDKFEESTTLYRAVGPSEFNALNRNGGAFEFGPNGSTMKQFGFNFDEVLKYANTNPDYGAILKIRVDNKALSNFDVSYGQIDPFIFKSGVVTAQGQKQLDVLNKSVTAIEQALL